MKFLYLLFASFLFVSFSMLPTSKVFAGQTVFYDISIFEDTYVMQNFPTVSPWDDPYLFVGTDTIFGKGITRTFLKPSFQDLKNKGVKAADIIHAELHLYQTNETVDTELLKLDVATPYMAWDLYSLRWNGQISSGITLDYPEITTDAGRKMIPILRTVKDSFDFFDTKFINKGISVRFPQEFLPALQFYSIDCLNGTSCTQEQKPFIRVFTKVNNPPNACTLLSPKSETYINSQNIQLRANASIDPDGDQVTYTAKVCLDALCSEIVWEKTITATSNTTATLPDGTYYAQCTAKDAYGGEGVGSAIAFNLDTEKPSTPKLLPFDQYTAQSNFILGWLPANETEDLEYQTLASERSTFSAYNTYSAWTKELSSIITLEKEKIYYFKVHSRDKAGNLSDWSEVGNTTLDLSIPQINYFKTNKTVVSPRLNSSTQQVEEAAYIQGSIKDANITLLRISLKSENGETVFSREIENKLYLWLHWPDNLSYPDGIYTAQMQGYDTLGNSISSQGIQIRLDTSPPSKPTINGLVNDKTYNTSKRTVATKCEQGTVGTLYLSGKILETGKTEFATTLSQSDGAYTFEATCVDKVNNKSSTTVKYKIDTTAPSAPALTLTYDDKEKIIKGKIYCRENGTVEFSKNGTKIKSEPCVTGKNVENILLTDIPLPSTQIFTARVSDEVGNWSQVSEKTLYLEANYSPSVEQLPKAKLTCRVAYNTDTKQFKEEECTWPVLQTPQLVTTILLEPGKFKTSLIISQPLTGTLYYSLLVCKKRDLFDPRTWFGCVDSLLESRTTTLAFEINSYSDYSYITTENNVSLLAQLHAETNLLTLTLGYKAEATFSTGLTPVIFSAMAKPSVFAQKVSLPNKKEIPYLSWIFASFQEVTQWHGKTVYQNPHQGIDFAVVKEPLYVPANGKVIASTYDKKDDCNQGGNYIALQHDNGLYSYFFHLESLNNPSNGVQVKVNQTVATGSRFATSGNSGMYNCLPLAYHLHYELRTSTSPATHVNPVPYMNIDWSKIATANSKVYSGRLSGNNPHPTY